MRISLPTELKSGILPTVTAVVPCYNYGRYLPECVGSVLAQHGVQASVIIVDDCSTDDSWQVAQRLAASDSRVRAVRHEQNTGAVTTFNDGLDLVETEYLVLISADDLLAPGALRRATALMTAHPELGMVYGHARAFSGEPPQWRERRVSWTRWSGREWLQAQFRRGWNPISSPEAVVRTSVQRAAGHYDASLPHTHDLEMWLRIAAIAGIGHVNGVDQAFYRVHGANMSGGFTAGATRDLEARFRAYSQFLDRRLPGVDAEGLRRVLARRASAEAVAFGLDAAAHGADAAEAVDAAGRLARRIDPDVTRRAVWRDLPVAAAAGTNGAASGPRPGARLRSLVRRGSDRARWWRWRLIGV